MNSYNKIQSQIKYAGVRDMIILKGQNISSESHLIDEVDIQIHIYLSICTRSLWFSQRESHIHLKKQRQRFDLVYTCMCLSRTDKNTHVLALHLLKLMEVECTLYLWESFINFVLNSCSLINLRDNGRLWELLCCSILHRTWSLTCFFCHLWG